MNDKDLIEKLKILLAEKMLEIESTRRNHENLKDDYMRIKNREVFLNGECQKLSGHNTLLKKQLDVVNNAEWIPLTDKNGSMKVGGPSDVRKYLSDEIKDNPRRSRESQYGVVYRHVGKMQDGGEGND